MQVKINSVEPVSGNVFFSLSPDISTLMGTDSVGIAGVVILRQFIQTPALKVQASVNNIALYVNSVEKNFGKPTGLDAIESFIKQRFQGQEIRLVDDPKEADYIIESVAETKEDISSEILEKTYRIKLASLQINLQLKNRSTNEILYKTQVNELYGYANTAEKAGLNAYACPKLNARLSESLFFLKRKILVY